MSVDHVSGCLTGSPNCRYPPTTDEKKKNLGGFFAKNSPPRVAGLVPDYVKAAEKANPSIKEWGIIGVGCPEEILGLLHSKPSRRRAAG
jgi:hypothetical protein